VIATDRCYRPGDRAQARIPSTPNQPARWTLFLPRCHGQTSS